MPAGEVARERRRRAEVLRPVDGTRTGVERVRIGRLELRQLEKHPIRDTRLEAGPVGDPQIAAAGNARRSLFHVLRAERFELARQEVGKAARTCHEQLEGRVHAASESTLSSAPASGTIAGRRVRLR